MCFSNAEVQIALTFIWPEPGAEWMPSLRAGISHYPGIGAGRCFPNAKPMQPWPTALKSNGACLLSALRFFLPALILRQLSPS